MSSTPVAPKVSPETRAILAQGGQILLPFEAGDAEITFRRWRLAELIEAELKKLRVTKP